MKIASVQYRSLIDAVLCFNILSREVFSGVSITLKCANDKVELVLNVRDFFDKHIVCSHDLFVLIGV